MCDKLYNAMYHTICGSRILIVMGFREEVGLETIACHALADKIYGGDIGAVGDDAISSTTCE